MIMAPRKTVNVTKPRSTRDLKPNPHLQVKKADLDRLLNNMLKVKGKTKR